MVKMVIGEVQNQTTEIKAFCQTVVRNLEEVARATVGIAYVSGLEGQSFSSIKRYLSTAYPALAKALVLYSEAFACANENYLNDYLARFGAQDLDSEVLETQIAQRQQLIWDFEAQLESVMQFQRNLSPSVSVAFENICQEMRQALTAGIARNDDVKRRLMQKRDDFLAFDWESARYFSEAEQLYALVAQGLAALGVHEGKIGAGSWNGKGFSFTDTGWIAAINERWEAKPRTAQAQFVQHLQTQYGFDAETTQIIWQLKTNIDEKYPELPQKMRDYLLNRLLGGFSYGDKDSSWINKVQWQNTAGSMRGYFQEFALEEDMFRYLGFSKENYHFLRYKVRIQNQLASASEDVIWENLKLNKKKLLKAKMEEGFSRHVTDTEAKQIWEQQQAMRHKADFAHQAITTATNLMDSWRLADALKGGHENVNNLSGWKGDATLKGKDDLVSFGPDDYLADLDAENIVHLMTKQKLTYEAAVNKYYAEVGIQYTRSELFLTYEDFESVQQQILTDLGVANLSALKEAQPDAYQFIKNLENKTNELSVFK